MGQAWRILGWSFQDGPELETFQETLINGGAHLLDPFGRRETFLPKEGAQPGDSNKFWLPFRVNSPEFQTFRIPRKELGLPEFYQEGKGGHSPLWEIGGPLEEEI